MRNLLQEFQRVQGRRPTILGMREHIFTGRSALKILDTKVASLCTETRQLIDVF